MSAARATRRKRRLATLGSWLALWGLWELAASLLYGTDVVAQLLSPGGGLGALAIAALFEGGRLLLVFVGGPMVLAVLAAMGVDAVAPQGQPQPEAGRRKLARKRRG